MIAYGSASPAPSPLAMVAPVSAGLIGPGGGQQEGLLDDMPGHGASIDARLDDLDGRVSALETGEAGEPA